MKCMHQGLGIECLESFAFFRRNIDVIIRLHYQHTTRPISQIFASEDRVPVKIDTDLDTTNVVLLCEGRNDLSKICIPECSMDCHSTQIKVFSQVQQSACQGKRQESNDGSKHGISSGSVWSRDTRMVKHQFVYSLGMTTNELLRYHTAEGTANDICLSYVLCV